MSGGGAAAHVDGDGFAAINGVEAVGKAHHTRHFEPVKHLETTFVVLDQADGFEHREMAGDGGPAKAQQLNDVADAAFTLGEFGNHQHAGRMPESLEDSGLAAGGDAALGESHAGKYFVKERNIKVFLFQGGRRSNNGWSANRPRVSWLLG